MGVEAGPRKAIPGVDSKNGFQGQVHQRCHGHVRPQEGTVIFVEIPWNQIRHWESFMEIQVFGEANHLP